MTSTEENTDQLIQLAANGNESAQHRLLRRHRDRLTRMVEMRMDRRVRARFDGSDVVQEAFMTAHARLPSYLEEQPIPFYPWLRKIAWEHLVKLQERHMQVQKRSVQREVDAHPRLNNESATELADRLAVSVTGPATKMMKEEMRRRVRESLNLLKMRDREILELLYMEQLETRDIAAILNVTQSTVWSEEDGFEVLTLASQDRYVGMHRISGNGEILVGTIREGEAPFQAVRWSAELGIERLGFIAEFPDHDESLGHVMSQDGKVVLGKSRVESIGRSSERAFVWDEANGMQDLERVFKEEYQMDGLHPLAAC